MARSPTIWTRDLGDLAAGPGTYILLLRLRAPADLPPRFGGTLPSGVYAYAGSARGPGGLRARCHRHLRQKKSLRWHIDWLSAGAADLMIAGFPDPDRGTSTGARIGECDLLDGLVASGANMPVKGFGSSDCRRCASHFVALGQAWTTAARAQLLEHVFEAAFE
jgi:Uri superfamily endonuclease